MNMHVHVYIYIYMCLYLHVCVYAIHMCICVYVYVYVYVHICVYVYTVVLISVVQNRNALKCHPQPSLQRLKLRMFDSSSDRWTDLTWHGAVPKSHRSHASLGTSRAPLKGTIRFL